MTTWAQWVDVRSRAGDRCEYCRMHQALQGATFHVEHIFPTARGGSSELDNMAWACPGCNLHKADRVEVQDPDSAQSTRLYHPRRDRWGEHFRWEGHRVVGHTIVGRAT